MQDETGITVEVQTVEGAKKGHLLFQGLFESMKNVPAYNGQVLSIGVLENGTAKGKPSVILLVKIEQGGVDYVVCAELTGANFLMGSQSANEHISRLLRKCGDQKNLGEMI